MSAATSADAVGIYKSVAIGEGEVTVPRLVAAIIALEAGVEDTRVTADVDVLSGGSFCWTARIKKITLKKTLL